MAVNAKSCKTCWAWKNCITSTFCGGGLFWSSSWFCCFRLTFINRDIVWKFILCFYKRKKRFWLERKLCTIILPYLGSFFMIKVPRISKLIKYWCMMLPYCISELTHSIHVSLPLLWYPFLCSVTQFSFSSSIFGSYSSSSSVCTVRRCFDFDETPPTLSSSSLPELK